MLIFAVILTLGLYIYLGIRRPVFALFSVLPLSLGLFLLGGLYENIWCMALAPGIFLVTVFIVSIPREEHKGQWPQRFSKWAFLIFIIALLIILTTTVLFQLFYVYGLFFLVLCIVLVISYSLNSRHATTVQVMSTIGSCMRQNLPLATALAATASGRGDKTARILRGIGQWLTQGYSLSEALKRGYAKCPGNIVAMISAAERINQTPLAIKCIEADLLEKSDEKKKINPVHPLYPLMVLSVAYTLVMGHIVFVIPKYLDIFSDTEVTLPASTRFLLNLGKTAWGWILPLFILGVWVVVPVSIYVKFRPRRPMRLQLLSRIGDFIKWHLPIFHWFEKNYSLIQVVDFLRLALKAGEPINEALRQALALDVNGYFHKRLARWREKVERGENIAQSAHESGLGYTLAWAFDDKVNRGNTPMILESLSCFYKTNYSYGVNLARYILWPCFILIMAAAVGFVVYAMFSPMVALTQHTIINIMP